jgi:hypothetical protein
MSPGRLVAALAVVLAGGAVVTTVADPHYGVGWAALVLFVSLLGAVLIAAVLLVPGVVVRDLRGRRPLRPGARACALALAVGGAVTFPVSADFDTDASAARADGGTGACSGSLPLAEAVQNRLTGFPYSRVFYLASCDD